MFVTRVADERWEEVETYPPGSTVLEITVFNLCTHNGGDHATKDNRARNNLEFFHHIPVKELRIVCGRLS